MLGFARILHRIQFHRLILSLAPFDRGTRLFSHWLSTKVDLHVQQVTKRAENEDSKIWNNAAFLECSPQLLADSPKAETRVQIFHSVSNRCPDLRARPK